MEQESPMPALKEIVINWHLIERCNYSCGFCFSKYEGLRGNKEVHRSKAEYETLLSKVYKYFSSFYNLPIRLSLAGGEPLLSRNFADIVKTAKRIGFRISVITNASLLTLEMASQIASNIDQIGVSIDSSSTVIDIAIGRCTNKAVTINHPKLQTILDIFRSNGAKTKINTVVCHYNKNEDMNAMISLYKPDKWKIFQVLPVNTTHLDVSNYDFSRFLERHSQHSNIISAEDNDLMTHSYVMIDPLGRFFQNNKQALTGYEYSQPILTSDTVASCFNELNFELDKFTARY